MRVATAYFSDCSVVLSLRPPVREATPSRPSSLNERLQAWERRRCLECQWALTQKNKRFGGGGALEVGYLRLVEDGSELGGALGTDVVASEAVRARGRMGNGERVVACQRALTRKQTLRGRQRTRGW